MTDQRISRSGLEQGFARLLKMTNMPEALRDYEFHATRGWQLDFAWPEYQVAVEIEGGVAGKSRHKSNRGYQEDCIKYNEAALSGWLLLRYTGQDLKTRPVLLVEEVQQAIELQCKRNPSL